MLAGYAIGTRDFTDGATRTVYRNPTGRQYVLDDDGRRVWGTWLPLEPPDPEADNSPDER